MPSVGRSSLLAQSVPRGAKAVAVSNPFALPMTSSDGFAYGVRQGDGGKQGVYARWLNHVAKSKRTFRGDVRPFDELRGGWADRQGSVEGQTDWVGSAAWGGMEPMTDGCFSLMRRESVALARLPMEDAIALTVLQAPFGYGKSTLIEQWVADLPATVPVLRVDVTDQGWLEELADWLRV